MINKIILYILRRKLFKGQFRIFSWLYANQFLKVVSRTTKPIIGNFKINVVTKNYIDACIYYMGDYEPYLKTQFSKLIKHGDVILDVGANIGFHTMYFAELVGKQGKVFGFEPIPVNYHALQENLKLNKFSQIISVNKALGDINSSLNIHINENKTNPGAFNLFESGIKNTVIECVKGDDFLKKNSITKVNFIKIDVEGYELEVLKGMMESIKSMKPTIIFEYDEFYQSKLNANSKSILHFLIDLDYSLYKIDGYGKRYYLNIDEPLTSLEVLAIPNKN